MEIISAGVNANFARDHRTIDNSFFSDIDILRHDEQQERIGDEEVRD